jgi:WD40 repeat protein
MLHRKRLLFVDNVQVGTLNNRVPVSLQIPSVAVPVAVLPIISEDCGFLEPVVEEVKVNKQLLVDANKLMTDARIKGMKAVASLAGHASYVNSVAFSPDGQQIVSGSADKLKVWSVSGGKEVASLAGHTDWVWSVAFSPDGQLIVSGSSDNFVKLWSVSGGKEVASLAGHTGSVCSVAFSPDVQHTVSGSSDNLVKVWS